MAAHRTFPILVGEMIAVIAAGDPITPIGVGIVMIDRHEVGHVLKERNTTAEGTQGFLLTSQKMKALTGTMTMASPMRLPMKTKSSNGFTR